MAADSAGERPSVTGVSNGVAVSVVLADRGGEAERDDRDDDVAGRLVAFRPDAMSGGTISWGGETSAGRLGSALSNFLAQHRCVVPGKAQFRVRGVAAQHFQSFGPAVVIEKKDVAFGSLDQGNHIDVASRHPKAPDVDEIKTAPMRPTREDIDRSRKQKPGSRWQPVQPVPPDKLALQIKSTAGVRRVHRIRAVRLAHARRRVHLEGC